MCWNTFKEENAKVRTAESDIPVFKVVRGFHPHGSPLYYMDKGMIKLGDGGAQEKLVKQYEAGCTYAPTKPLRSKYMIMLYRNLDGYYAAERGIHSYSREVVVRSTYYGGIDMHVFAKCGDTEKELDFFDGSYMLRMDCVIPKGTKYLVNERGEYVSERIRVTGFRTVADKCAEGGSKKRGVKNSKDKIQIKPK